MNPRQTSATKQEKRKPLPKNYLQNRIFVWFEQSSVYLSFITLARVIPNMETVLMQFFHITFILNLIFFCKWKIRIKMISRWSVYCAFICNVFETFSLNLSLRKLLIQFQNFKFKTSRTINVPLTRHFLSPFSSAIFFLSQAWTYYYYIRSLLVHFFAKIPRHFTHVNFGQNCHYFSTEKTSILN